MIDEYFINDYLEDEKECHDELYDEMDVFSKKPIKDDYEEEAT